MSMKNLPLLVTLDYPPNLGGVAEYLRNVVEVAGGVEVWAPVVGEECGVRSEGKSEKVGEWQSGNRVRRMRMIFDWIRPRWLPLFFLLFWKCLWSSTRPSAIVISHVLPVGMVARWMKVWFGVPYAVIVHGYDVALVETADGRKRRQGELVLRSADLVVANAHNTAAIVRRLGVNDERVVVCYPCPAVVGDVGRKEGKEGKKEFGEVVHLLTAGRLTRRKAVDVLLRAVAELRRRGVGFELVVAGEGSERESFERLTGQLGIGGAVKFVGRKSAEELAELYRWADIFVQVPRDLWPDFESFGMVYLEASLFGVPAVASRTGGIPEAVLDGETGLLVAPDDPVATAEAIIRLVNDVEWRRRLGEQGRQRVLDEFRWEKQLAPLKNWLVSKMK